MRVLRRLTTAPVSDGLFMINANLYAYPMITGAVFLAALLGTSACELQPASSGVALLR